MRKPTMVLLVLALISAISIAMTSPTKASLNMVDWRPSYISYEPGHFGNIIYKDGATAHLVVSISNDYSPPIMMNVSKIVIDFWQIADNETLDLMTNPRQLSHDQTGIFTISFPADGAKFLSGFRFDYNLIVEWVNATTGPRKVVGYWEWARGSLNTPLFEVYPATRADADDSLAKYYTYYNHYNIGYFDSVLGRQKANQAILEKQSGDVYSDRGDYASALTQYNKANTLWEEALTAEFNWRNVWDNAELNVTLTDAAAAMTEANAAMVTAEAAKAQADAAVTNAYGWYFIGMGFAVGWTLMGIGAIIWAWKRPRPAA